MIFTPAPLAGAWVVDLERREDERGFFARSWCRREFEAQGLDARLVQCNISRTAHRGTLRGMHWQAAPHGIVAAPELASGWRTQGDSCALRFHSARTSGYAGPRSNARISIRSPHGLQASPAALLLRSK